MFALAECGFDDPVLVSATDGVGTKLRLAIDMNRHSTVGIDLVAMCVNDIVVQGAEPLFFLDYFASGRLDVDVARTVIDGIARGCEIAGAALIGGETAEMPDMYGAGDYDLAGFCVGAVERTHVIDGRAVAAGDVVLGLASSGLHSNGFSLARRIALGARRDVVHAPAFWRARQCAARADTHLCQAVAGRHADRRHPRGRAHHGRRPHGERATRAAGTASASRSILDAWERPPIFDWLADNGPVAPDEMLKTFNCGIGMAVIVAEDTVDDVATALERHGETVWRIGSVVTSSGARVEYRPNPARG